MPLLRWAPSPRDAIANMKKPRPAGLFSTQRLDSGLAPCAIDTECTAARRREIQEYEAVQHRDFTVIEDRQIAGGRMRHEICDRHFAGEYERRRPRDQGPHHQHTPSDIHDA